MLYAAVVGAPLASHDHRSCYRPRLPDNTPTARTSPPSRSAHAVRKVAGTWTVTCRDYVWTVGEDAESVRPIGDALPARADDALTPVLPTTIFRPAIPAPRGAHT
ncbi:MAG: hypothetical protein E6J43_08030 [Chloroflexi bacterium]|nr:MAG: hypothetical protein E6J43_08030 [Chloroflexota bacterium]